jgi:hypothetical protein
MFDNEALNIAIGLIFVFVLYSLLAAILLEIISGIINLRAALMVKAITVMLNDREKLILKSKNPIGKLLERIVSYIFTQISFLFCRLPDGTFAHLFFCHPSIKYLSKSSLRSKPSYIEPANFSATIVKILRGPHYDGAKPQIEQIRAALYQDNSHTAKITVGLDDQQTITGIIKPETLDHLRQLFVDAQNDVDRFKGLLEGWFNEVMGRTTGWYKRKTNTMLFFIGILIAASGNVDTIKIYSIIAHDKTAREQLVTMASKNVPQLKGAVDSSQTELSKEAYAQVSEAINKSGQILGIGYASHEDTVALASFQKKIQRDSTNFQYYVSSNKKSLDILRQSGKTLSGKAADTVLNQIKLYQAEYDTRKTKLDDLYKLMQSQQKTLKFKQFDSGSLLGWLITALAISLGSPFWFDILNKVINLRSAGQRPEDPKSTPANDPAKALVTPNQRKG